jgi:DNA repair protein RecO (recombination protein O)
LTVGVLARPTAHTEALVLRVWSCGDTSCIASLLTRQEGFVKVLAKGARGPRSRLRPLIEPGRLVDVEFSLDPGRELQFLRGGSVELDPLSSDPSLEKSAFLLGALELIDRCRPLGQAAGNRGTVDLFAVCEDYVRVLSSSSCRAPALLFFAFEWELLERHGMAPEIDSCLSCGREGEALTASTLWFSPAEGGLVCAECSGQATAGMRPLSHRARQLLQQMSHSGLAVSGADPLDGRLRRELGAALHHFMGYHLPGYRLPAALDLLRRPGRGPEADPPEPDEDQDGD